jgi:hypothetical protein
MKKISEVRVKCELCGGKRKIYIKNEKEPTQYKEACPLCENKGYLAIIRTEIV